MRVSFFSLRILTGCAYFAQGDNTSAWNGIGAIFGGYTPNPGPYEDIADYDVLYLEDNTYPLAPLGDADGDGFTNLFEWEVTPRTDDFGYDIDSYTTAALDPDVCFDDAYYTLELDEDGGGTAIAAPDYNRYHPGAQVSLTAQPYSGWVFGKWTGDLSVDNTAALSFVLDMDANKSITAEFHRTLTLTQTGGSQNTLDPAPGLYTYPGGTQVPLEAAEVDGWAFREWQGDVPAENTGTLGITIDMDDNKDIAALFDPYLTTGVNNASWGSIAPAGENSYPLGAAVDVTATLESNYYVQYWEGDFPEGYEANTTTLTIVMDEPKSLTAYLGQTQTHILNLSASGPGTVEHGTTFGGSTNAFEKDTQTTLDIDQLGEHARFVNWTGDVSGIADPNTAPVTVTMDADRTIVGNFKQQYLITLEQAAQGGTASVTAPHASGEYYDSGEIVFFSATPDSGYRLKHWLVNGVPDTGNSITLLEDTTVTPVFVAQKTLTLYITQNSPHTNQVQLTTIGEGDTSADGLHEAGAISCDLGSTIAALRQARQPAPCSTNGPAT